MRFLVLLILLLIAVPVSAQWTRIDTNYSVSDTYATNLVGSDATHVFATVLAGQPVPDRFLILRSANDGSTWAETFSGFNGESLALDLLLSDDDGATGTSIADGYPRDANNAICLSNYAVTPNAVIGNAWACSSSGQNLNGVYRYTFGGSTASDSAPTDTSLTIELVQNPARVGSAITLRQLDAGPLNVTLFDALGRHVVLSSKPCLELARRS